MSCRGVRSATKARHDMAMRVSGLFPPRRAALATSMTMSDAAVDGIIARPGAFPAALPADPATETRT